MIQVVVQVPQPPEVPLPPVPPEIVVQSGPPEMVLIAAMAIVGIIVGGVILWPVLRAFARRIEGKAVDSAVVAELDQLRARVAELEANQHRVAELEERVDFSERLLSQGRQDPARSPR